MINTFETTFEARERLQQLEKIYQGEAVDLVASITTDGVPQDLTGYSIEGYYQPVEFKGTDDERTFYAVNAEIAGNKVKVHWTPDKDFGKGPYSIWALLTKEGDESYPVSWRLNLAHSPGYPIGETPEPIPQTIDFSKYTLLNAPWLTLTDAQVMDGKIDANTQGIAANTGSIVTLNQEVTQNAQDIATNAGNIATNTADIATNTQGIAENGQAIGTLRTEFEALQNSYNETTKAGAIAGEIRLPVTVAYGRMFYWHEDTQTRTYEDGNFIFDFNGTVTYDTLLQAFGESPSLTDVPNDYFECLKIAFGTNVTAIDVHPTWEYSSTSPFEIVITDTDEVVKEKSKHLHDWFAACNEMFFAGHLTGFQFWLGGPIADKLSDRDFDANIVMKQVSMDAGELGPYAFAGWKAVENIKITPSLGKYYSNETTRAITIGKYCIEGCTALKVLDINALFWAPLRRSITVRPVRLINYLPTADNINPDLRVIIEDSIFNDMTSNGYFKAWWPYFFKSSEWDVARQYEVKNCLTISESLDEPYLAKTVTGNLDASVVSLVDIGNKVNRILALLKRETDDATIASYTDGTTERYMFTGTLIPSSIPSRINLTSISVGSKVTRLEDRLFYGCNSLTSVTLREGLLTIGPAVFYRESLITQLVLPSTLTSIEGTAFQYCTGLSALTIPQAVTSIGSDAFGNTTMIVTFEGKTKAEVQAMENFPWGIPMSMGSTDGRIVCSDGPI